jgi:hypothetical protein
MQKPVLKPVRTGPVNLPIDPLEAEPEPCQKGSIKFFKALQCLSLFSETCYATGFCPIDLKFRFWSLGGVPLKPSERLRKRSKFSDFEKS